MVANTLPAVRAAELCARLIQSQSKALIQREMHISQKTIHRFLEGLRLNGVELPNRPVATPRHAHTDAVLGRMQTTNDSNRTISRDLGASLSIVNKLRKRHVAELRAQGLEPPRCGCGQDLHHPYFCWYRQRETLKSQGKAVLAAMDDAVRDDVRRMLLAGMTLRAVGEKIGASRAAVMDFLAKFSAEERAYRRDQFTIASGRRRTAKMSAALKRPKSTDPRSDPTYAAIAKLVSSRIDNALRDDIISEAYVEFVHGRIKKNTLREGVKQVQRRVFAAFANPWGDLSLDVSPQGDDGSTWADRIADERALEAFEAIA